MKKSLFLIIAVAGLLAGAGLEAKKGWGGHHGGHRGWRHRGHGFRHGGWGRHHGGRWWRRGGWGWGGGFGISVAPDYYGPDVVYIDDPYNWYFSKYPRASWDAYVAWLEANSYRFRRPWKYYYGPRYHRRWRARPRVGFGIGFGF